MKILKPRGRAGFVLPDGTLFGEGMKTRIKEALLTEYNLQTIVRLPNGVFNPYTGICTNILFFNKGAPTTELWYYEHPYPAGMIADRFHPLRLMIWIELAIVAVTPLGLIWLFVSFSPASRCSFWRCSTASGGRRL